MIDSILGTPLGYIVYFAYSLTGSYGLAILIFAIAVRIFILFPVGILAHKNSLRLLKLQPEMDLIKRRYTGDKEQINEEQYSLFKRERYNPFIGLIPLFVQLVLIIGIMRVMLDPMRHLHGINASDVEFVFLGLDLLKIPSIVSPSPELIIPLLSVCSALGFCLIQNAISPGALGQSKTVNTGMTVFTVVLSLYLTLVLPVGVGLYWTAGNLTGIGAVLLLDVLFNPKKFVPEALTYIVSNRRTPEEQKAERRKTKQLQLREKADIEKFTSVKKQLVFYALTSGQYKYYKNLIEYILENSNITVHYLTNDPDDAVFDRTKPGLIPYYAGQRKTISLMLKLDADIMVTTVPDLQSYHMKRSIIREDIEYIYVFHAPVSSMMQYKESAFDHFDTVFCIGSYHIAELRRREELTGLPKRNLVKTGYGLYDELLGSYIKHHAKTAAPGKETPAPDTETAVDSQPHILIAPSWQKDNIFETCIDEILSALTGLGYRLTLRPHPQFIRLFPERMEALRKKYIELTDSGELIFELDFSGNESIFASNLVITDWSGIAYEFSYCTSKPCIFINTPQKIMNPNYLDYGFEPMEITIRSKVGISIDPQDIGEKLAKTAKTLLGGESIQSSQIEATFKEYIFHPNRSAEAGGKYIIEKLSKK